VFITEYVPLEVWSAIFVAGVLSVQMVVPDAPHHHMDGYLRGQVPITQQPDISSIEWVRFRKPFTAGGDRGDRTVFVVAASSLAKFLEGLDTISSSPSFRDRVPVT
jgi:hypothetical protein